MGPVDVARVGVLGPLSRLRPSTGPPVVVFEGPNNTVDYDYQMAGGAWGLSTLPGSAYSALSVGFSPSTGLPVVVFEGPNNTVDYDYQMAGGAWGLSTLP